MLFPSVVVLEIRFLEVSRDYESTGSRVGGRSEHCVGLAQSVGIRGILHGWEYDRCILHKIFVASLLPRLDPVGRLDRNHSGNFRHVRRDPYGRTSRWWIPIFPIACFGAMIMSLVFLLYLSPKRASDQIDHIQANSVRDLETLRKDFILRREDISEINLRRTKVAEIGHGIYSSGAILSVSTKRSEPVILVTTNREKLEELVELIEDFAERNPTIRLTEN